MKHKIGFINILKAELYKVFGNKGLLSSILLPTVALFLLFLYLLYSNRAILFRTDIHYPENPWILFFGRQTLPVLSLLMPIIIGLISFSICDIEYRNNNLRFLFSMPIRKSHLYLSKLLTLLTLITSTCVITCSVFIICGYCYELLIPAYKFSQYYDAITPLIILSKIVLTSLCVGIMQLYLSLLFRNLIIPIFICVFFTIMAIFIQNETYNVYFPFCTYTRIASAYSTDIISHYEKADLVNAILFLCFSVAGYFAFSPYKKKLPLIKSKPAR